MRTALVLAFAASAPALAAEYADPFEYERVREDALTEDYTYRHRCPGEPAVVPCEPTRLLVIDDDAPRPPPPPDVVPRQRPYPRWVERHLQNSRDWADPFFGPELDPELSIGDSMQPAWDRGDDTLALENVLVLNLYLLELRFPSTFADGARPRAFSVWEADLRLPIPFANGHHRLVPIFGFVAPLEGEANEGNSGARGLLAYGISHGAFTGQLWGGFSVEPDVFTGGARRNVARYGGLVGFDVSGHLQAQVEIDVRNPRGRGYVARVAPGVHWWPYRLPTVQIGIAGLLGIERDPGDTEVEDLGGVFELSYNFL